MAFSKWQSTRAAIVEEDQDDYFREIMKVKWFVFRDASTMIKYFMTKHEVILT